MSPKRSPQVREALRRWLAEQGPPSPHVSVRRLEFQMRKRTLTFFDLIEEGSVRSYIQTNRIHLLMPEKLPIVRRHIETAPDGACRIVEPTESEYMKLELHERGRALFKAGIQPNTPENKRLLESLANCEPLSEGWMAHTRLTSYPKRVPPKLGPVMDADGKLILDAQYYIDTGIQIPKAVLKHWNKTSPSWQNRHRRPNPPPRDQGLFELHEIYPQLAKRKASDRGGEVSK